MDRSTEVITQARRETEAYLQFSSPEQSRHLIKVLKRLQTESALRAENWDQIQPLFQTLLGRPLEAKLRSSVLKLALTAGIAGALSGARTARGLTLRSVGEKLGLHLTSVQQLEVGRLLPYSEPLYRALEQALDLPGNWTEQVVTQLTADITPNTPGTDPSETGRQLRYELEELLGQARNRPDNRSGSATRREGVERRSKERVELEHILTRISNHARTLTGPEKIELNQRLEALLTQPAQTPRATATATAPFAHVA